MSLLLVCLLSQLQQACLQEVVLEAAQMLRSAPVYEALAQ